MDINNPQPSTAFPIPEEPIYDLTLRQLLRSDDADATELFNPLLQAMINNTHAVKLELDALRAQMPCYSILAAVPWTAPNFQ